MEEITGKDQTIFQGKPSVNGKPIFYIATKRWVVAKLSSLTLAAPAAPTAAPPILALSATRDIPAIEVSAPPIAAEKSAHVHLWDEVFRQVNDETKKWIRDHGLSSSEQAKPEDQIKELIDLVKSKTLSEDKDAPLKIEIGNQKIVLREYVADVVAFLTMAGDVAISFAPPQASAPWAAAKAVLKVRMPIYNPTISRNTKGTEDVN
ncbi:pfs [Trichoderma cornu-damae]|uniref:Pfs n=1 Tax=Trichoderma cornu-damae TaxID=654480 RepID=A0A9P8QUW0_9HYPO|nr:pfs [Trichoderma cornu-damae]